MRSRFLALATISFAAIVPAARGMHPATTDPTVIVDITVTITDSRITLNPNQTDRGQYARFVITNRGRRLHTFTIGTTKGRGAGVQTGFSRTIKPRSEQILLLYLDYRGKLSYHSSLKTDLKKPGMKGFFTIL